MNFSLFLSRSLLVFAFAGSLFFLGSSVGSADEVQPNLVKPTYQEQLTKKIDQVDEAYMRQGLSSAQYIKLGQERDKLKQLSEKAQQLDETSAKVASLEAQIATKKADNLANQKVANDGTGALEKAMKYEIEDKKKLEQELNPILDKYSTDTSKLAVMDEQNKKLAELRNSAKTPEEKNKIDAQIRSNQTIQECIQLSNGCDQSKVNSAQENLAQASAIFMSSQQKSVADQTFNLCKLGMCIGTMYTSGKDPIEYTAAKIIRFATRVIAPLAILGIIYGGLQMIISVGSEDKVKKGRAMILYAVLSLVGVFSAWVIVTLALQVLYSLGA